MITLTMLLVLIFVIAIALVIVTGVLAIAPGLILIVALVIGDVLLFKALFCHKKNKKDKGDK